MTVYQGSRYENNSVVPILVADQWRPTVFRGNPPSRAPSREVLVLDHENMQQLAHRVYGNSELWWLIADANPQILYPDVIPAGTVLRIF